MDATIRTARVSDAQPIADLTAQLGYDVPAADVAARLARILARGDHQVFVAELEGRPIGWLHALIAEYLESGACVVIGGLVVDRGHRKRGIGRRLMERAEAWARERGCAVVRLWSTTARTAAHRFYEGLGYANVKTQYAFAKSLDPSGPADLGRLAPRVDPEG
jgi:GNAT superfamily N-acetyltransferase